MLKISRKTATYKCPRHPRRKYDDDMRRDQAPACGVCDAIAIVYAAALALERAERNAVRWINTVRPR